MFACAVLLPREPQAARTMLQTLVACAQGHLNTGVETLEGKARAAQVQLLSAAQLMLPQLLATYHATMHPEDRACLLTLRALDAVLRTHACGSLLSASSQHGSGRVQRTEDSDAAVDGARAGAGGDRGVGGFLSSMAFVWGPLWQHIQSSDSVVPAEIARLSSRPDIVDPRFAAATLCHTAPHTKNKCFFHQAACAWCTWHSGKCMYPSVPHSRIACLPLTASVTAHTKAGINPL